MIVTGLVWACAVCALIPTCLFLVNMWFFREPGRSVPGLLPRVEVLIPVRDEAENVEAVVASVLASHGVDVHITIYDDNSTDDTALRVQRIAAVESRVTLICGKELPAGWNGKQHACWQLAQTSTAPLLLFLDADVRLEPEAIARCIAEQQRSGVPLLSGFPRVVVITWMEWLLLPLIQFVLLGLLPMFRMRHSTKPPYAAGCGQFMMAERSAYFQCGGHAAICNTRHDGLKLAHLFREHGLRTDVCDLTQLANVRMYRSAAGVWSGLAKNATEGLASPGRIFPITLLLFLGQVLPSLLFVLLIAERYPPGFSRGLHVIPGATRSLLLPLLFYGALCSGYALRLIASVRYRQPLRSALLHPLGTALLLALQWYALVRQLIGKPVGWRERSYSSVTGEQVG